MVMGDVYADKWVDVEVPERRVIDSLRRGIELIRYEPGHLPKTIATPAVSGRLRQSAAMEQSERRLSKEDTVWCRLVPSNSSQRPTRLQIALCPDPHTLIVPS